MQRGRCLACHNKIDWSYPLIELWTAISWLFIYRQHGLNETFLWFAGGFSLLILLAAIDLRYFRLPNGWLFILACYLVIGQIVNGKWQIFNLVQAVALFFMSVCFYHLFEKKMGAGDLKFITVLALYFSWLQLLWVIFLASSAALIVFLALFLIKNKKLGSQLPFGPFLAVGAMLVSLFT